MSEQEFRPRISRAHRGRRDTIVLNQVLASTARAGRTKSRAGRTFDGSRIGRGSVAARMLGMGDRYHGLRARRAVIKTQLVRLSAKAHAAAQAHLRYIQRDGVSRDGESGHLYSADGEGVDGKAFLERCDGDRHQFRLIVSVEDGAQYEDLKPLIRRFMGRMEEDLGTRIDWVAANHLDTLHPHTHIILRGKDDRGENLVISPEYIKHGMRNRLAGLVSLDLGPRSDFEIEQHLQLEVHAERLTSLDRGLLRRMDVDRIVAPIARDMSHFSMQVGRLRKLEALGLAEKLDRGQWQLAHNLEPALRSLGERGDIIRTMQRELKAADIQRAPAEQVIHAPGSEIAVIGKVVARGLADEARDTHYLVVDGVDGRSHFINIGKGEATGPLPDGGIVRVISRTVNVRDADIRIAAIAAERRGNYSIDRHLSADPTATREVAESHERRLLAIRRAVGELQRFSDGTWSIPDNYLDIARRYEVLQAHRTPVEIHILSSRPLERLTRFDGPTWLDREMVSPATALADSGFGREVQSAMLARRAWLTEQDLGHFEGTDFYYQTDVLAVLGNRELVRVAAALSNHTGLEFCEIENGSFVEGTFRARVDLSSSSFAFIERGHQFLLVPWRPELERGIDLPVMGRVGADVRWTIGRTREIDLPSF